MHNPWLDEHPVEYGDFIIETDIPERAASLAEYLGTESAFNYVFYRGHLKDAEKYGYVHADSPLRPHSMPVAASNLLLPIAWPLFLQGSPNYVFIPTSVSRVAAGAPEDARTNKKVAILDSGSIWPWHPVASGAEITASSFVGDAPLDAMGHGSWNMSAAYLGEAETRFGLVRGVAHASQVYSASVLSPFLTGRISHAMKALKEAVGWGAKVVLIPLGAEQQGPVETDPFCRVISQLPDDVVVVASVGNSGRAWSVESPAVCPRVIGVGAYSITDGAESYFSSRGPSGAWYETHQDVWHADLEKYGPSLKKPNTLAPGGGRAFPTSTPGEVLYSACVGYFDGYYDLLPDTFEGNMGTSMAAAHVAGLQALK